MKLTVSLSRPFGFPALQFVECAPNGYPPRRRLRHAGWRFRPEPPSTGCKRSNGHVPRRDPRVSPTPWRRSVTQHRRHGAFQTPHPNGGGRGRTGVQYSSLIGLFEAISSQALPLPAGWHSRRASFVAPRSALGPPLGGSEEGPTHHRLSCRSGAKSIADPYLGQYVFRTFRVDPRSSVSAAAHGRAGI